jgi:nitroreductase
MTIAIDRTATTDSPILDVLAERWSARVFDPAVTIDEAALASALEAARWSPSANNTQPWRFIVTRRGSNAYDAVYTSLRDFNKSWAGDASALVVAAAPPTRFAPARTPPAPAGPSRIRF